MTSKMSDSDFVKNFSLMIGALIVLSVVIFIVANVIGAKPAQTTSINGKLIIAKAVNAVANILVPTAQAADGKGTYTTACFACHGTGAIPGVPKTGDKAIWAPRIKKGKAALYKSAISGIGNMPPKGGRADIADGQIKAAVDYMIAQVK